MSWIKISDENGGTFALEATPDPQQVITIKELEDRLAWLQTQGIKDVPDQETLDFWNSYKGLSGFINEKDSLLKTINDLKEL